MSSSDARMMAEHRAWPKAAVLALSVFKAATDTAATTTTKETFGC